MLTYLIFLTFIFVKISDANADLDESVGAASNDHEHFTLPKKQKLSSNTPKRKNITQDMVNEMKIKVMEEQLKIMKKEHDKKMEILEIKLEIKRTHAEIIYRPIYDLCN